MIIVQPGMLPPPLLALGIKLRKKPSGDEMIIYRKMTL